MDEGIIWAMLIENIDYHHGRWYEYNWDLPSPEWEQCGYARVVELLDNLAPDRDHGKIIQQFKYRDSESRARQKE